MSTPEASAAGLRLADCTKPAILIATVGGSGLLRPAPGTWGSLAAALMALGLLALPLPSQPLFIALSVLALVLGLITVPAAMRASGLHDPGQVVIDEVVGVWAAIACLPSSLVADQPLATVIVCFALFRCFDILKPGPVGWADGLPGATGVMLDDLLAGMIAGACAFAFLH